MWHFIIWKNILMFSLLYFFTFDISHDLDVTSKLFAFNVTTRNWWHFHALISLIALWNGIFIAVLCIIRFWMTYNCRIFLWFKIVLYLVLNLQSQIHKLASIIFHLCIVKAFQVVIRFTNFNQHLFYLLMLLRLDIALLWFPV